MPAIRTVLGDITADTAGVTLTHEHLRYAYAGCESDHHNVWDFDATAHQVAEVVAKGDREYGIHTIVDLTPAEIGRHPELFAEVARQSGANVVATTGFFPESSGMGIPFHWRRQSIEYVAEMLVRDLTEGMVYDGKLTPYRAGILKASTGGLGAAQPTPVGPDGRRIGEHERRVIKAVAIAQRKVGCAINTHTQPMDYAVTNPGIELLDELERGGADPTRVIIGHAFVHPQLAQLRAICERGACLQIDHIGIPWQNESAGQLDELIANAVCALADLGYLDRLVFSYDRFFSHARGPVTDDEPEQLNELVPIGYIFDNFAVRLAEKGFGKNELNKVLVENPARLLAF
jgi:phosphotriesterase-related protein